MMSSSNTLESLKQVNDWLTRRLELTEEQVREGEDVNSALTDENRLLKSAKASLSSKLDELCSELEHLRQSVQDYNYEKQTLKSTVGHLEEKVVGYQDEERNIKLLSEELKQEMEKAQGVIFSNTQEIEDMRQYIAVLEEANNKLQSEATERELDTAKTLKMKDNSIHEMQRKINDLESSYMGLRRQHDAREGEVVGSVLQSMDESEANVAHSSPIDVQAGHMQFIKKQLAVKDNSIEELERRLESVQVANEIYQDELKDLKKRLDSNDVEVVDTSTNTEDDMPRHSREVGVATTDDLAILPDDLEAEDDREMYMAVTDLLSKCRMSDGSGDGAVLTHMHPNCNNSASIVQKPVGLSKRLAGNTVSFNLEQSGNVTNGTNLLCDVLDSQPTAVVVNNIPSTHTDVHSTAVQTVCSSADVQSAAVQTVCSSADVQSTAVQTVCSSTDVQSTAVQTFCSSADVQSTAVQTVCSTTDVAVQSSDLILADAGSQTSLPDVGTHALWVQCGTQAIEAQSTESQTTKCEIIVSQCVATQTDEIQSISSLDSATQTPESKTTEFQEATGTKTDTASAIRHVDAHSQTTLLEVDSQDTQNDGRTSGTTQCEPLFQLDQVDVGCLSVVQTTQVEPQHEISQTGSVSQTTLSDTDSPLTQIDAMMCKTDTSVGRESCQYGDAIDSCVMSSSGEVINNPTLELPLLPMDCVVLREAICRVCKAIIDQEQYTTVIDVGIQTDQYTDAVSDGGGQCDSLSAVLADLQTSLESTSQAIDYYTANSSLPNLASDPEDERQGADLYNQGLDSALYSDTLPITDPPVQTTTKSFSGTKPNQVDVLACDTQGRVSQLLHVIGYISVIAILLGACLVMSLPSDSPGFQRTLHRISGRPSLPPY